MAKPNYQFEKRRREQMKAKKKEEKRLRKEEKKNEGGVETGATGVTGEANTPSDERVNGDER